MDFSAIFQLRTKKFWWMDAIFYFAISLLIATIFCYLIFFVKNNIQREDIKKETAALGTVGTEQQKGYEKEVAEYQKKIIDFADLLKNHEFASNVFAFLQAQTMPNIWFKQFSLDNKNRSVQLSGEADSLDAFSRQVENFEENKHVKSITALNSSLSASARIGFNINLVLDQDIFGYIANIALVLEEPVSLSQLAPEAIQAAVSGQASAENQETGGQQSVLPKSSEKLITSFHLLLNPEIIGIIDETSHTIALDVPQGTDFKNLTTSIVVSPGATVLPASFVPQNFENPVSYMVVAEDGSTQDYKVQVAASHQASGEKPNKNLSKYAYIAPMVAGAAAILAVTVSIFLRKRSKKRLDRTANNI